MTDRAELWIFVALVTACAATPVPPAAPGPTPAALPAPATAGDAADARALVELEHRWVASYVAGDADFLDQLYRDDVVLVSSRGEISGKRQELDELRTGAVRYRKFDTWDLAPRVYGDVAVVTARSHIEGVVTASQREFVVDLRVIDVFVRAAGRWQVAASQGTRLGP